MVLGKCKCKDECCMFMIILGVVYGRGGREDEASFCGFSVAGCLNWHEVVHHSVMVVSRLVKVWHWYNL